VPILNIQLAGQDPSGNQIPAAWRVEIERRMAELDSGTVQTIPWKELRPRLYRR
jgi:putative addiction module component (TIGR02574 family)